ncbi:OmpA family protein [Flavobacterium sp. KACC 22761]|uniref:OmpA family protein n=1 Tax=Flavobacterium sp. KACC 22761 TaxID=3092665 RepID=UPI002A760E37|nr:OmpA family protein [Flavobacterium sp. KACC 22761]WPO78474.1 OmpA family protein [Flavobacterium sp. KACC 22761]
MLCICLVQIGGINAQDRKVAKADEVYKKYAFVEAAKLYQNLVDKGNSSLEVAYKLGNCYYFNGLYSEASEAYAKVFNSGQQIEPEFYFRYAQALNNSNRYDEAYAVIKKYYAITGKKDLSENWKESKLLADIKKQSGRYEFKPVDINSPSSDFGSSFLGKDKVVYASAKDTGIVIKRKHSWNEKSFLKMYVADITVDGGLQNPVLIKGDINTKYHQSSPAITKNGKFMYFTRTNFINGKLGTDKAGTTFLKIYVAENVKGEWKNIKELGFPVNGDGFSSAHPALNADETELYFVSDRGNRFGDSDIYVVSLNKGGFVGNDVKKLGDEINTLGRETYPFVDGGGILYFSSDGHPGLGGLDVFAAVKDENGVYHVVNAGDGVNTNADDFAYGIQNDSKKGYFSSNRSGNDDIYGFTETRPVAFDLDIRPIVYGVIKDSEGKPVEGVSVEVYNATGEKTGTFLSDADGKYNASIDSFQEYKLMYKKPGLIEKTEEITPMKPLEKRELNVELINERQIVIDGVTKDVEGNLTDLLDLKPIYFDYNGYKIRESSKAELNKVVEVMRARPNLLIKVNSHTDSRGKDDYNMTLSKNRAKATVDYIVNAGIPADRLTGEGFGETMLINRCSNGVKCSEQEHELNRRSEFMVSWKDDIK